LANNTVIDKKFKFKIFEH